MKVLGIVLIVLGIIGLAYGGFSSTREKKVVELGPIEASTRTRETVPIPPLVSGAVLVGGVVLLVASRRKV
jgi:hypothetical protein